MASATLATMISILSASTPERAESYKVQQVESYTIEFQHNIKINWQNCSGNKTQTKLIT